jgi:hypothetical protein
MEVIRPRDWEWDSSLLICDISVPFIPVIISSDLFATDIRYSWLFAEIIVRLL